MALAPTSLEEGNDEDYDGRVETLGGGFEKLIMFPGVLPLYHYTTLKALLGRWRAYEGC